MSPHHDHVTPEYSECEICGTSRHLCLSVPIPRGGVENISICVMCAKRIAKAYVRFVATAKSRSYVYWYQERKKFKMGSGLEASD